MKNLCLAGGVALNCVGNGRILREGPFESIWIQPAAGDAGGALGVAAVHLAPAARPRAASRVPGRRSTARCSARASPTSRSAPSSTRAARCTTTSTTRTSCCRRIVGPDRAGEGRRLVPGPDGVRPARARLPDHPRRRPQPRDAVGDEPEDQVPRVVPAVRADRAARARRASTSRCAPTRTAPTCCWSRRWPRPSGCRSSDGGAQGLDKLKVIRSDVPAITHVDYSARVQTVDAERHGRALPADEGLRAQDRLPGDDQHQLQRPRRADRLHAARTPTAASWPPTWTCWCSRTSCCCKEEQPSAQRSELDEYLAQFALD